MALLALLILLGGPARHGEAGDDSPEPPEVAAAVLDAISKNDRDRLRVLAAKDKPDPWLVAERLLTLGEHRAALTFSELAARPTTRGLTAYVGRRKGKNTLQRTRAALASALEALDRGDFVTMAKVLEGVPTEDGSSVSAQVLFARGIAEHSLQRTEPAWITLTAALEAARDVGWLNLESYVLGWAISVATQRKDRPRAVELARARVGLEERWGRKKVLADALYSLAEVLRKSSDYRGAQAALERALVVSRDREDSTQIRHMLISLCAVCVDARELSLALAYGREAMESSQREKAQADLSASLGVVGGVYFALGELPRARSFLEKALALTEKHKLGTWLKTNAGGLLAETYCALGQYPQSVRLFERTLATLRNGKDAHATASLLNNMAVLYADLGNDDRAEACLREALRLFEMDGYTEGVATACVSLGTLATNTGQLEEAEPFVRRALALRRELGNPSAEASALSSLASLEAKLKHYERAAELYQEALALYEEGGSTNLTPLTRAGLGRVLAYLGKKEESIESLERAVEEAHAGRSLPVLVHVMTALAEIWLHERDRPERALLIASEALTHIEHLLGGLAEEEGIAARAAFGTIHEIGALAAARMKNPTKALRFLETGRAGSLLESLGGRDALRWADLPQELLAAERKARLDEAAASSRLRAALRTGDFTTQRAARKAVDAATQHMRDTVARIQREAKAQAGLCYPRPATLSKIQRALVKDEALVVYGLCYDQVLAVVVRRKTIRGVSLGDVREVRTACEAVRELDNEVDLSKTLAALRGRLVTPLKLKRDVKHVIVSPVGPLCYLPMALLFDTTTSLTPSATVFERLRAEPTTTAKEVLALGDPRYDVSAASQPGRVNRGSGLTPLPATRAEVETIGTVVLTGDDATEAKFRETVATRSRWRAVHLACHGFVDPKHPALCSLAITPTEEDDGFLTTMDVFRLKIPADLAVLSACETGSGAVVRGEGLVGLVRSFMYAGSPRVIASLWKVDDAATRALMVKFYEVWNGKAALSQRRESSRSKGKGEPIGAAAALAEAQAFVRGHKKWAHPYYWAAWVLWGLPE